MRVALAWVRLAMPRGKARVLLKRGIKRVSARMDMQVEHSLMYSYVVAQEVGCFQEVHLYASYLPDTSSSTRAQEDFRDVHHLINAR